MDIREAYSGIRSNKQTAQLTESTKVKDVLNDLKRFDAVEIQSLIDGLADLLKSQDSSDKAFTLTAKALTVASKAFSKRQGN